MDEVKERFRILHYEELGDFYRLGSIYGAGVVNFAWLRKLWEISALSMMHVLKIESYLVSNLK
jgi:hypothetical protein